MRQHKQKIKHLISILIVTVQIAVAGATRNAFAAGNFDVPNAVPHGTPGQNIAYNGKSPLVFATFAPWPPFTYVLNETIVGYNKDLVTAVCKDLKIVCIFRTMSHEAIMEQLEIEEALSKQEAEIDVALIGQNPFKTPHKTLRHTHSFLPSVARILSCKNISQGLNLSDIRENDLTIGVLQHTEHENFIRNHITQENIKTFASLKELLNETLDKKLDLAFVDGLATVFWKNQNQQAIKSCRYIADGFVINTAFGSGVHMTVSERNAELLTPLNMSLERLKQKNILNDIFFKWFPENYVVNTSKTE